MRRKYPAGVMGSLSKKTAETGGDYCRQFFRLSCFPAYVTMIFEKSMDEYGVPPDRVAALSGKGWYRRYHTMQKSLRYTQELL